MANELQRRRDALDELFPVWMRDWFNDNLMPDLHKQDWQLKADVAETDQKYVVKVDMPGFDKKDIHVSYENDVLTIAGKRESFADHSDHEGNLLHSELSYGQMSRSFRLPGVDLKQVNAKYDNGVLVLDLPKVTPTINDNNRIQID